MCSVDGCEKPARSKSGFGLCDAHYMRMYRRGVLEKKGSSVLEHSSGYIMIPAKGHPVALGRGHAYEHRVVYYDQHGAGPFKCHWCGAVVTLNEMHVDHLDDNKKNNSPANLVSSCPKCNKHRGQWKSMNLWRKKSGWTAFGITLTPNEWAEKVGISRTSIVLRMKKGMSLEDALTMPKGNTGPKNSATCNMGKSNKDFTDWR